MIEQLKPCPFCGGESVVYEACPGFYAECNGKDDNCDAALGYSVCHDCSYGAFETREEAIRAWNTRAAPVVKVLVWDNSLNGRWIGTPPINLANLAFWVFSCSEGFKRHTGDGVLYYATLTAAKAAAQADYEARILAALE